MKSLGSRDSLNHPDMFVNTRSQLLQTTRHYRTFQKHDLQHIRSQTYWSCRVLWTKAIKGATETPCKWYLNSRFCAAFPSQSFFAGRAEWSARENRSEGENGIYWNRNHHSELKSFLAVTTWFSSRYVFISIWQYYSEFYTFARTGPPVRPKSLSFRRLFLMGCGVSQ